MKKQKIKGINVPIVVFQSNQNFSNKQARQYALEHLYDGSYENCIIEKVYVDQKLVLENYKI